jgi:electron transfer flavoprotein beta subunit
MGDNSNMLKIVVPVKQVPDMTAVKFDTEKGTVDRSSASAEINPFDLYAIEAAVRIKETVGAGITAISMGPPNADAALRDAISRGVDKGILLTDRAFAGADTLATSYTLAAAVKKLGGFDLIICGEKTVDGDTGQVGPEMAEHLGIPHVAYVSKIETAADRLAVTAEMEREQYHFSCPFPVLITVTKDVNVPRLPTFRDKANARRAKVDIWSAADLATVANNEKFGGGGSPTRVWQITIPGEEGRKSRIFRDCNYECLSEIIEALSVSIKETN